MQTIDPFHKYLQILNHLVCMQISLTNLVSEQKFL